MDFFDLHCDTPSVIYERACGRSIAFSAVSLSRGSFGKRGMLPAIFVDDECGDPFGVYRAKLDCFKKDVGGDLVLCCDEAGIADGLNTGRAVGILSVENGRALGGNADNLYTMHRDGVRSLTLTWNGANELGGGCRSNGALTGFGRLVIKRMNGLRMAVDLAHANEKTFFEALNIAEYPICTHTACKAVRDHPRNLCDRQIKALIERGGLIGLCFYDEFLGGDNVFESVFAHFYHLLDLGAENVIAIGSDFDGCVTPPLLESDGDVPELFVYLERRGIPKPALEKIFFKNSLKFFNMLLTNEI